MCSLQNAFFNYRKNRAHILSDKNEETHIENVHEKLKESW